MRRRRYGNESPGRTVTIPIVVDQEATTAGTDDYSLQQTSVTFQDGETSRSITLTAADDDVVDDGEKVVLSFGDHLPEAVSAEEPAQTTVTILDATTPESGGGCAIAAETHHGTAATNLLLATTVMFPVLLRKTRSTDRPGRGEGG